MPNAGMLFVVEAEAETGIFAVLKTGKLEDGACTFAVPEAGPTWSHLDRRLVGALELSSPVLLLASLDCLSLAAFSRFSMSTF